MITHVVLLKPKAEISETEIATVLDHVQGLQKDIPGIIETQAGANLSSYNQGYTYGFVMRFVGNLAQCSTEFERGLPLRRTLSQNF